LHKRLYFQVIVAILAGVAFGYAAPEQAIAMKPLGDGFIRLIKMLIPPILFCTLVTGIAGMRNMKNAGRVGIKALIYFETMTTFSLLLGLVIMHLWQPGAGMHIDPSTLDSKAVQNFAGKAAEQNGVVGFLLQIIPGTLSEAFVTGNILQVLLVSILFACALMSLGNHAYALFNLIQQLSDVLFTIIGYIVRLAPLGAFGAMAFTIGKYGIGTLAPLIYLMLGFYLTCVLFIAIVLGFVMRSTGLHLWPLLTYIKEEIFIVLGTSSSEAALPRLMDKMTALGCSRPVVGMVIPTGYSFNLDGTSIYLTMAALFIAQALDIDLTLAEEMTILAVLLLTSKGAAGITGSGFIVLAGSLSAVGHIPVEGLALILGIDRFMSEARAITNLIGNAVGTIAIAKWERALDMPQAKAQLGL
jgi:aerobic C4-dicarboxylate transport protein